MLRATNLRYRYRKSGPWVVDGVDLAVAPGEIVGLHGPSGAGKSTLGRLMAGLLPAGSGRVEPAGPGPVQMVLQHPDQAMNPRWRVRDILAEADPAAPDPGLVSAAWLDRYPHELSGGELQRVNLARALLARPAYLVADEITASLDALTQAAVWGLLTDRARSAGIGVLAISHDLPLLEVVADRVVAFAELTSAGAPS